MGNKKIKVCFFSPASFHYFLEGDQSNFGGAELQMYLLADQISKNKDFEVIFLVGNFKQKKITQFADIKLIRSINLSSDKSFYSKFIKSIKYFFLLIKINPDVIITTTYNPIVGITSFYKLLFKKKHIHRSANDVDTDNSRINENGFSGKIFKYALEHANIVLAQNIIQKRNLTEYHKIEAVIFKNVFNISKPEFVQKKHILWVGRFVEFKNPELFLELAKNTLEYNFIMICPYHKNDFAAWNVLKNKAEQISNLKFIEKVPFKDIQIYFNEAILFVNTSDYEGFPNTFLQAAQAKTPIVSLNVNPNKFITENECGIFCENVFKKMLQDTKQLLQNETDLKLKGENVFRYLKKNHDIKEIGKQLENIIIDLI